MSGVRLVLRQSPPEPLTVDGLTADRLAALEVGAVARMPAWAGRRQAELGDFFAVARSSSTTVQIDGDLSHVRGLAAGMSGGEMIVEGNVGDDVAVGMSGGTLIIRGDAGDRLAAVPPGAATGLTGGEVVVTGSAGREVAARARRGLVVVGGDVGPEAARAMIAGSLFVFGRVGAHPGRGSKRGTIVAAGGIDVPSTYRYACTYRPPHVRLTMTYLRRRYGLAIDERLVGGRYRRYCGDAGDPGKGEILEWVVE